MPRLLVVEDEYLIRMLLEDMLADLGYEVAAAVGTLAEASDVAANGDFDAAILDVNLDGQEIYPVADILANRGLPFVFVTGYGERSLREPYRRAPGAAETVPGRAAQDRARRAVARRSARHHASETTTSASLVMNGSSVRSSRSGVMAMRLSLSAARSLPAAAPAMPPRAEGDPVIGIAAPVVARVDAQQFLVALALRDDGNAGDFARAGNREN